MPSEKEITISFKRIVLCIIVVINTAMEIKYEQNQGKKIDVLKRNISKKEKRKKEKHISKPKFIVPNIPFQFNEEKETVVLK